MSFKGIRLKPDNNNSGLSMLIVWCKIYLFAHSNVLQYFDRLVGYLYIFSSFISKDSQSSLF